MQAKRLLHNKTRWNSIGENSFYLIDERRLHRGVYWITVSKGKNFNIQGWDRETKEGFLSKGNSRTKIVHFGTPTV